MPRAPPKLNIVNAGNINLSSLCGSRLYKATNTTAGLKTSTTCQSTKPPRLWKTRPKAAQGRARVTLLGSATRKYQCQGEVPHSCDLFSTVL